MTSLSLGSAVAWLQDHRKAQAIVRGTLVRMPTSAWTWRMDTKLRRLLVGTYLFLLYLVYN